MARILLIAYGNPLRFDDGVAWRAADLLEGRFSVDDVEIIWLHQLGPELAESISQCECVIFIDAASEPEKAGEVRVTELTRETREPGGGPRFCHSLSPAAVLGLAEQLYRAPVKAFCATVAGQNFDHGEGLSPVVGQALPLLLARIQDIVRDCLRAGEHAR
jgi:hydrogenase maturation protease